MSKLAHSHQPSMDEIEARILLEQMECDLGATEFAMELLIPRAFLLADLRRMDQKPADIDDSRPLEKLCEKYRVSRQVMTLRLLRLREDDR